MSGQSYREEPGDTRVSPGAHGGVFGAPAAAPVSRAKFSAREPARLAGGSRILTRNGWVRVDAVASKEAEAWTGLKWGRIAVEPEERLMPAAVVTLRDGSQITCSPAQRLLVAGDRLEHTTPSGLKAGAVLPGYRVPEDGLWDPRAGGRKGPAHSVGAQIGARLAQQFTFDGGLSDGIMRYSPAELAEFLRGVVAAHPRRDIFGDLEALRDLRLLCARLGIRTSVVEDPLAKGKGTLVTVCSSEGLAPKKRGHLEVDNHINHSVMRVSAGKQCRGFRVRGRDTPFLLVDGVLVDC